MKTKTTKRPSRAGVRVSSTRPSAGSTAARSRVPRKTESDRRRTKPKTAYELLARVAEHILEEPKRYYQGAWGYTDHELIADTVGAVPACGTTACRGGWIVGLSDGMQRLRGLLAVDEGDGVHVRANQILGLPCTDTSPLFGGFAVKGTPGTVAYAKKGAAGVRAFMKAHAAHLKARLLKDVPTL